MIRQVIRNLLANTSHSKLFPTFADVDKHPGGDGATCPQVHIYGHP